MYRLIGELGYNDSELIGLLPHYYYFYYQSPYLIVQNQKLPIYFNYDGKQIQYLRMDLHGITQMMNGNIAFLPFGYLSPNYFIYLLCFQTAHLVICTIEKMVKMQAVQFLVRMEYAIHPRASQKQLAELTRSNPKPYGIFLTFEALTQSLSSFVLGDRLKSPIILWHLQFNSSKTVQQPTIAAIVVCEQLWPDGKKNSSIPLDRANSTQQWKLLMRTLLKGIDYLLNTCTYAVSYSRFTQCKMPRTKAVV